MILSERGVGIHGKLLPHLKPLTPALIQSMLLGKNMLDAGGVSTICRKKSVFSLVNSSHDYVFETFVYYAALKDGLEIYRLKISYGERLFGNSQWQMDYEPYCNLSERSLLGLGCGDD